MSQTSETHDTVATAAIRVFYDGSCPLCRAEIGFLARQKGAEALAFEDVSVALGADDAVARGLSCRQAMARMHVQLPDGTLLSGARAFLAMWGALPRFSWLARALSVPPLPSLLEMAYRGFLIVRPMLQRLARQRSGVPPG